MLSEMHNANCISFWLKEFVRRGGSVPNEFCCDMSLALLNAAVCAFTDFSNLNDYINALFSLNLNSTPLRPRIKCMIRIDIAHLIKNVAKYKHFDDTWPKIRETYTRCVWLLIKETDFGIARKIIFCVLIMTYASTEGKKIQQTNLHILQNFLISIEYFI